MAFGAPVRAAVWSPSAPSVPRAALDLEIADEHVRGIAVANQARILRRGAGTPPCEFSARFARVPRASRRPRSRARSRTWRHASRRAPRARDRPSGAASLRSRARPGGEFTRRRRAEHSRESLAPRTRAATKGRSGEFLPLETTLGSSSPRTSSDRAGSDAGRRIGRSRTRSSFIPHESRPSPTTCSVLRHHRGPAYGACGSSILAAHANRATHASVRQCSAPGTPAFRATDLPVEGNRGACTIRIECTRANRAPKGMRSVQRQRRSRLLPHGEALFSLEQTGSALRAVTTAAQPSRNPPSPPTLNL